MAKVMVVMGTRPEAIKLAPVVQALAITDGLEPYLVATAQHRGLLDQVLDVFGLQPDCDLDVLEAGQTLTDITVRALARLSPVIESQAPAALVVQGDTTTTFVGALAGFYHHVPVVHVEAGLRTGDPRSPFPEEINRRLTTQVTSLHLPPTAVSRANLLTEGVSPETVVTTGNTVIDALLWSVAQRAVFEDPALRALDDTDRPVLLVTSHRRESWGEGMRQIGLALADIARARPDVMVIVPVHPNPVVRAAISPAVVGLDNVALMEPLGYGEFCRLLDRATVVLTDSGGIQEEAPSLGKPVLVMRDKTERPEGIAAGNAKLVGTDRNLIASEVLGLFGDRGKYEAMAQAVNPYGDGHAATRCVAAIAHLLGSGAKPSDFHP